MQLFESKKKELLKKEKEVKPLSQILSLLFLLRLKSFKNEPLNILAKIYNCDHEK